MSRHKKIAALIVAGVAGAMLTGASIAHASETAQIHFAAGTFKIDAQTCQFSTPEAEPGLGRSWLEGRVWAAYEDQRHDVKMGCNTARQTRVIACFAKPIPRVSEAAPDKQNFRDERGMKAAIGVIRDIQTCVLQAGGMAPVAP